MTTRAVTRCTLQQAGRAWPAKRIPSTHMPLADYAGYTWTHQSEVAIAQTNDRSALQHPPHCNWPPACAASSDKGISDTMRLVLALLATACARPTVREIRNLAEYDRLIQHHKTETGLPVVVDFYSDSCGPCRMIAPAFKKLAKEMKDRAVFAKVNVAMARDVASRMRVSSMPTFHFYEDGVKRHEFSGAGEYQLRQLAEKIANDAQAKNVKLSTESLRAFYDEHDSGKDIAPIIKKCASLAKSKDCVGGAARELAKKLKQKFGSAPQLSKRFGEQEPPKPKPKRTSRSLDQASTDELLAELAKRSDDDDLAFAASEAAELARKEMEEEDEDEDEEDDDNYDEDNADDCYAPTVW